MQQKLAVWRVELKRLALGKLRLTAKEQVNRILFEQRLFQVTGQGAYFEDLPAGQPRLHIIVVPNVLHFLTTAVRLLPDSCAKGFVLNGASVWEAVYLRRHFPGIPQVRLPTFRGKPLQHGAVVDWLLGVEQMPFGLMDHDLFVLDPVLFDELVFHETECMVGLYSMENAKLAIRFPTTHFLYLHAPRLKRLIEKHRLSCKTARRVPARLRPLLAPLGFERGVYLKPYLRYFDTMNLVMATSLAEGLNWRILERHQKACIHIGHSSGQQLRENPLASFIGLQLLKRSGDVDLQARYANLYSAPDLETWLATRKMQNASETLRLVLVAEEMLDQLHQRLCELD